MFLRFCGLTVVGLISIGCQPSANTSSILAREPADIIGGQPVSVEANVQTSNSTVALVSLFESRYSVFCSGTLISSDIVLTAAHCVKAAQTDEFYIAVGNILPNLENTDSLTRVSSSIVHAAYIGEPVSRYDDIAILKLEHAVSEVSSPLPLVSKTAILPQFIQAIIIGFGLTRESPRKFATNANFAVVEIDTSKQSMFLADQHLGTGACAGDSGGSVVLTSKAGRMLVAETRGESPSSKGCSGVGEYTPVGLYEDFIRESASSLGGELPRFIAPEP